MARNQVQFQPGLSLTNFLKCYATEEQCREALFKLRWPAGFICPDCGHQGACCQLARRLYQCNRCHHQASLTARTIFDSTKLPLTTWFLAIYLLTQRKNSLSALQLSRELGVSYNTAWQFKHKIMQVMFERERNTVLSGRIEVDDAYLGGERPGKRGRGSENKGGDFFRLDASITQFKGGLYIDRAYCDLAPEKVEAVINVAKQVTGILSS